MYWQHKIKHLTCGAHFIMCSDFENWPHEGKTSQDDGTIHCPECGGTSGFLVWKSQVRGFIFEAVPGSDAAMIEVVK